MYTISEFVATQFGFWFTVAVAAGSLHSLYRGIVAFVGTVWDFVDWIKDWKEHGCPGFPIFHRPHSSLTKKDINTSVTEALAASFNAVERKIQQQQSQLELAHQKSANDSNTIQNLQEALAASSNTVERKIQQLQSQLELAHQKSANDANTIQNLQEQLKATKIDYSITIKVLEEQRKASQIDYSTTIKILKDTNHQFSEHFSDFQQKLRISHAAEIAHLKELAQLKLEHSAAMSNIQSETAILQERIIQLRGRSAPRRFFEAHRSTSQ